MEVTKQAITKAAEEAAKVAVLVINTENKCQTMNSEQYNAP